MAFMDHAIPVAPAVLMPPFELVMPAVQTAPVVFASPHSGRNYRADFVQAARLDAHGLRRSEDSFVDELFAGVPGTGAPLLCATFPRAYCDPNREPWELDPAMFADDLPSWVNTTSARVGAGLGTLARVVATGESIYREKLPFSEAEFRVHSCWRPYHDQLAALLAQTREQFGACLLIDCHSMPAHGGRGTPPDMVLGDAHGTACSGRVTGLVEQTLTAMGYEVRRNDPYAGGYVTRHYGRPREGVHALQIEIARSLYMDEQRFARRPGFAVLQEHLTVLAARLAAEAPALLMA
jgi:N-formylglutamate deformylase